MGQTVQFPVASATVTITPTSGTPKDNILHQVFTASQIFKDIVAKNCSGFTVNNVQNGAPNVEQISFPYKKPSECFKALADYVGWDWFCDYDRDLHFFDPDGATVTPAPITVTSSAAVRKLQHNLDKEQLRNRVFVKGGVYLSDPYSYEIRADGVALAWNLVCPPVHNLSLKVSGVTALVGREYIDTESTSFAYMVNESEGILKACSWTTTLASGTILIPLYQYEMPVIERQDDYASQAAVAAIEGGDGIYEYVITDESITTLEAARALAQQSLREFANPRVNGSFETYVTASLNLLTANQSSVETDLIGFTVRYGATLTRDTVEHWNGSASLKVATPGSAVMEGFEVHASATIGQVYTGSLYLKGSGTIRVVMADLGGAAGVGTSIIVTLNGTWQRVTPPAFTAGSTTIRLIADTSTAQAVTFYADGLQIEQQAYATPWMLGGGGLSAHWAVGQAVTVSDASRGISGQYTIQKVTRTKVKDGLWNHKIEYGGRLLGIQDYLKAIVSAQQNKRTATVAVINKLEQTQDGVAISDSVAASVVRLLPFLCGDVDAICGQVILAASSGA
jgi:hypothetical protein